MSAPSPERPDPLALAHKLAAQPTPDNLLKMLAWALIDFEAVLQSLTGQQKEARRVLEKWGVKINGT